MKNILSILISFFLYQSFCFCQIESNTHSLLFDSGELSTKVKDIIEQNSNNKQFVFLGESFHQSGADLVYKTKLLKYLVNELEYKDIIFESDFYGLFLDKNPKNIYWTWFGANQCKELFEFLKKEELTLWGMDSKLHSIYSKQNFTSELEEKLKELNIKFSQDFVYVAEKLIKLQFKIKEELEDAEFNLFMSELNELLEVTSNLSDDFLFQSLKNLKSSAINYMADDYKDGIAERERQMADNLNYLSKKFPNKKFIVWAANAHIAKTDNTYMGDATMGCEFLKLNPNNSYHIAFASIKMPYRKLKKIEKQAKNSKNLLYYLPDLDNDYFIDIKQAIKENIGLKNQIFTAILWSAAGKDLKTKWLEHFDSIIYIENGELTTFRK